MTLETLTHALGWAVLISWGLLALIGLIILPGRHWLSELHGRMFDIAPADVRLFYFKWLGYYKVLVLLLFLSPYLVLRFAL